MSNSNTSKSIKGLSNSFSLTLINKLGAEKAASIIDDMINATVSSNNIASAQKSAKHNKSIKQKNKSVKIKKSMKKVRGDTSLTERLVKITGDSQPHTILECIKTLENDGWKTSSDKPYQVVTTAFENLKKKGIVKKVDKATYQINNNVTNNIDISENINAAN